MAEDTCFSTSGNMACSIKCKIIVTLVEVEVKPLIDHVVYVTECDSYKKAKSLLLKLRKAIKRVTMSYTINKASSTLI